MLNGQATQIEVSSAAIGIVVSPKGPKQLEGPTSAHSSMDHSHVQSDSSNKASFKCVIVCKPKTKAQLEAEAWRPLYEEF